MDPGTDVPPPEEGIDTVKFTENASLWARQELYNNLPNSLLNPDAPELLQSYPAHLHIDILPSHQSKGWGPQLLSAWLNELKALGIAGCHLGMDGANAAAGRFYAREGWIKYEDLNDRDSSEHKGEKRSGGTLLVKKT